MSIEVVKADRDRLGDVQTLLEEYYEALEIQKRDTPDETRAFLEASAAAAGGGRTGIWLAYDGERPVGCVVLRLLSDAEAALAGLDAREMVAGEVKRLFVRPTHRGRRVADRLVEAVEACARASGLDALYLDSKDDLVAALAFYDRRGYAACARYNTNPQATIFMRKSLS